MIFCRKGLGCLIIMEDAFFIRCSTGKGSKKKGYIIQKRIYHDRGGNRRISHNLACDNLYIARAEYFIQPVKIVDKLYVLCAGFAFNLYPEFFIAVEKINQGLLLDFSQKCVQPEIC